MEEGLREGITILVKCEEAAEILESKIMEYRQESEVQSLIKELVIMKTRIQKLLTQARDGINIIQDAKVEVARQAKEIEEHKEKIAKLDKWLETINNGLKQTTVQTEVLTEEDIVRYIEVYERYIREYEEYEIILKSITVISQDESSQSLRVRLNATQKALEETKHLVIIEIERLRQVLLHMRSAPEVVEDDISQTDRTIDSTSMPEEVVEATEEVPSKQPSVEESVKITVHESKPSHEKPEPVQIQVVKETVAIETQTGKSLMSEPPSVSDKSVICQPDTIVTHDVAITCAPPIEMAVQTSEPHSETKEILENIQVRQTISDGHETIEIASRPVTREQRLDEKSLLVDANYRDDNCRKDSQLNITHSLPQSFETVMVEPDETTTEVVVDADGTRRIIVKKVRKTLVTRQQILQSQQHESHILSSDLPLDQAYSQIVLRDEKAGTSTTLEDGGVQHMEYQSYGGQVLTRLPGGEVTIQEFTSRPDMTITMEKDMNPEQILLLAEGQELPQVQTSTSSVTAVVQQVTKRIVKTRRRIIRRVVIIDGKEHVTEEIVEEPDNVEVVEEQIPRVSINVRERGDLPTTVDEGDDDGKGDHPALPRRKDDEYSQGDKPRDYKPTGDKPDDKPSDDKPDDKPGDSKDQSQQVDAPTELTQAQQLEKMMQDFIQKEGSTQRTYITQSTTVRSSQERESTPVKTVTVSESFEILPDDVHVQEPDETTYIVQEPHEGQTTYITGGIQHSTFESSSTNVATVVQKVTRKITRTRRRIIKHITIIDGKEHVTEEVIEEPDDVEVIEEEPRVSHSIQTEGVKTKRIKVIKQVQIIDGKEHVTEQIVEEPDDEYVPDSTITTEIDVKLNKPDVLEVIQEDVSGEQPKVKKTTTVTVLPSQKATTIVDVTKSFIGSESEHFGESKPEVKHIIRTVSEETIPQSFEKPSDQPDTSVNIIKQTVQFTEPEVTTITTSEQPDMFSTTTTTKHFTSQFTTTTSTESQKNTSLIDVTKSLISSEMEHPYVPEDSSKKPEDEKVPIQKCSSDATVTTKTVTVTGPTEQSKTITTITTSETSVPEYTQKETVTVVSSSEPVPSLKPGEEDKPQVVADLPKDKEPELDTVMQIIQETVQSTEPQITVTKKTTKTSTTTEIDSSKPTVTETVTKTVVTKIPETNGFKDTSLIDITKSLIGSEMDHSAVSKIPASPVKVPKKPEENKEVPQKPEEKKEVPKKTEVQKKTGEFKEVPLKQQEKKDVPLKPEEKKEIPQKQEIPKEPEPVKPDDVKLSKAQELKPKVTVEMKLTEERLPAQDVLSEPKVVDVVPKQPTSITDTLQTQKDTSLFDITKSFLGTEIDHSAIHKTPEKSKTEEVLPEKPKKEEVVPEKPKKEEPISKKQKKDKGKKPKKDETIPERPKKDESPELKDTVKIETGKTITTTIQKDTTTSTSIHESEPTVQKLVTKSPEIVTIVKETIQTEPLTTITTEDILVPEPELAQAVEVTDVTPEIPKDTSLVDLNKSFIGTEMDHTLVSKIPAVPVTREELLEIAVEAIEEPELPETLSQVKETVDVVPGVVTTTKVTKQVDVSETVDKELVTEPVEEPQVIEIPLPLEDQKLTEKAKSPEKQIVPEKKPKDSSIQFITQEITEQTGVTQFNISQLTREMLEKESIHSGTIHSPVKTQQTPLEKLPSDIPKDVSQTSIKEVSQVSTGTATEPKDPVQPEVKPSSVYISLKEESIPEKKEAVASAAKEVIPQETIVTKPVEEIAKAQEPTVKDPVKEIKKPHEPVDKEPKVIEQHPILVPVEQKPVSAEDDFLRTDTVKQPQIGIVELTKELIIQEGSDKYERTPKVPETINIGFENITSQITTEKSIVKEPQRPQEPILKEPVEEIMEPQEPVDKEPKVIAQQPIPVPKKQRPVTVEDVFLQNETVKRPQIGIVDLTKELIIQEGSDKYEQIPKVPETVKIGFDNITSQITTEKAPSQSTVEVETLKVGTTISEFDVTEVPVSSEMSYIRQYEPQVQGSSDSVNKLLMTFGQPEKQDVPSQTTEFVAPVQPISSRPGTTYDISMLLQSERLDTDQRGFKPDIQTQVTETDKPEQTVDIKLALTKYREAKKVEPKVKYDLKVEDFEAEPIVVKKDIEVILPSEVKITKETVKIPVADVVPEQPKAEITPESVKDSKKSKKKKKHKAGSTTSESTEVETDKSIAASESSSLSHYVELPTSPPRESPTPTEEVLEPVVVKEVTPELVITPKEPTPEPEEPAIPVIEDSYESESLTISEERGYEAEDISLGPVRTPDKKKKHKKRKPHGVSEETAYPVITTTETDDTTVTTPVEMLEPTKKGRDRKRKKKTPTKSPSEPDVEPEPVVELEPEPEVKPESPKQGTEVEALSPKEESYHTISETSDITTVKIVEECVHSSPETAEREVGTILKFPVPVVEEIFTQEYSIQTSPEETEPIEEAPRPETSDIELQTTPTSMSEVITQTIPVEDKEAHTQTIEEVTTVVEKLTSDTEIQTSRSETPEQIVQLEATTQVIPHDISTPEEKFSQTTPVEEPVVVEKSITPEIITESREMQTSPQPVVLKDEKSTEVIVETTDTDIQTMQHEITEQGTSTTPVKEKELTEMGMQTPEVPLISTFTQSDTPEPEPVKEAETVEVLSLPSLEIKKEVITVDSTQQTTPREEVEAPKLELKQVETAEISQQTTPREEPKVVSPPPAEPEPTPVVEPVIVPVVAPVIEPPKREIITVDSTQQTSPRSPPAEVAPVPIPILDLEGRDVITIDSTQQTSPRDYSEGSISTSTEEPYEVHLRAQISIPQATTDFIESERSFEEPPQSILGDKYKQRKRKSKKKTESPLQSPESLSDPINTELSLSVTPTSEDISLRDFSSIDEGISQLTSPVMSKQTQHKLTYSDVVQRSKSKSPSPSKTIIPQKSEKARLLDALEKRTQSITEPHKTIPDDSMTVALLEPSVEQSYNLVVNKELDEVKNSIESNDPSRTERSVIIVIETISIWLEEIQYKIQRQTVSGVKSTEDTERLKSLKKHVQNLKHIIEVTEVNEEIITLIETLTRQVDAVNTLNSQSSVKVKEVEKEWIKFLDDTNKLSDDVEAVKIAVDDIILSEIPTLQKLEKLDAIETNNLDNFVTIRKLFKRCRSLVEANPKRECPTKLYNADDDTKQIENTINIERDRLLQLASLAEEYEQTLQDFGQITDVAEALLDGKIIVSDLDHLHEEIQKHRKFFVNLSHCRAILESLEDNLDSETRAKFSSLHNSLHDRATVIIDRAASRAQQMTLAASRWSLLQHGMKEERQWLVVAQQRVPDLSNVTSRDHEQYINLYQSISLDVSHHYAKMLRLLSITESLQNLIVCSGLETECSVALDTLLKLQEDVDSRLTRLTAFKENWVTYDLLIDRIEGWMKIANKELEFITPENITTTGNLRRFWELKAQHEVHNNLKNESGVQFEKALEILPVSDEMTQRQFFSKIEDKWSELASKIDSIHSSAIQNISDRDVSSGEKLNILEEELRELRASLDSLKGVIKSEDELNLYIERLQVMTSRIDRIQNELGRLSLLPTAESERLGALLTQSGILDDQIAVELERSMLLKEKIMQVQAGILRCQKSQRRAKLTLEECEAAERLGSDVVERASENCDKLIEELASQWRDILVLRQSLHTLPTSLRVVVSPTGVERDISALQEIHSELEAHCSDLSARLRAKLHLWRRFERQLELVQGAVREADYMVELLTVQGQVDYDRLLKATEKLETLSESLSRRSGELVGELTAAAAPLEASTEPSVAASLRRELDDAAAAYEYTCTNLNQLCDKYHKAVELWKRYRDAAAAVRAFADFQESRIHALRPDDAPNTAQACLEQEARVAELRSLAARVAAETGSRALQADADALARRLQLVAGAVQALADLGEARQLARAKAQHAKEKLCDMRQDLTPVHEDGEIVEDKLIALRDNLIALGKSEADIAPAKAELPDIDRDVSDEHSIVRILELWQAMFRDTFLHYHRLSTALVRSGDAATALRLWREYLIDLQSFLSGSVPADYENLTEHRRLCRVHKNLLTSQRSVLMNENRETRNRELADKFDTLTNLHNETLARIVERHDEVCTRIAAWDDYREVYTELLRWLKEMEREKEKLQLRYVHIKRIQKILAKIQNLSDKVPEGRRQSEKLLKHLKKVLEFTEEAYGASVRMEYAGIVKRVDNLQASLDTWRDFLNRILGLINEYENLSNNELHKLYSKTQDEIMSYSDEDRLSRPQLKKTIEKYSDLRTKIVKTEIQIEALSVIQEQLKECLSPQDIRLVNQRVWQLRQQRADLEHQLSIIIHRLQERLEVYTIFETRVTRFIEWISTLETRLEASSQSTEIGAIDPQDLIRRINSEVQAETSLKEREFEWLTETGTTLVDLSKKDEKSYSKNTSKQLKDIQERWHKMQETGRSRIAKINELLETISQLEERLTEIRLKLHSIESNLSTSVVLEYLTTRAVDEKFKDRDDIHKNIENESGEVGETLNLCELVFNDPDVLKGNFDLRNLHTGVDIVEKKWKNICEMSEQRKNALKEIRKSAELANSLLPKVEKKLDSIERRVEKIETRKQRGEPEDESVSKAVMKDLESIEGDVKRLEDAYSRIVSARGVELRGSGADEAARLRAAVRRWQQLRGRLDAAGADAHRQFVAAHGRAVVALAEADVRLTRALHLAPTPLDKVSTLKELDGVEQELLECQSLVEDADRLAAAVSTVSGVSHMVAEYRALFADVRTRLDLARAEVVGDVDSAVQVDTLKWETDAALQVDTLTSKETYRAELTIAVKETSEALEALRLSLHSQPNDKASSDELATAAKEIAKAGAKPGQTLELAKHLSELLLTECDATEDEAMLKEVESLSLTYEDLLSQAKKRELQINNLRLPHSASYALTCEHESGRLTCPLCSERNWKQLDNDLWRLEQWLQFAEATDDARTGPPEQYDALEDVIQDHREFLLDLDSHKSIVVSLNVVGSHVAAHARSASAAERVRARLAAANQRWDTACRKAHDWQAQLQRALLHNRQFHDIVVELVAQLAAAERTVRAREPLRLGRAPAELQRDFRRFAELRDELRRAEPRVLALHEAAALLAPGAGPHSRLSELRLRLQSLRKLCSVYALKLGAALARRPASSTHALAAAAATLAPQLMEDDDDELSSLQLPPLDESQPVVDEEEDTSEEGALFGMGRGLRFVCRVARASLPFQALLLLLLGAAALAPHASSDCRRSPLQLDPVLRYPDGPPPL